MQPTLENMYWLYFAFCLKVFFCSSWIYRLIVFIRFGNFQPLFLQIRLLYFSTLSGTLHWYIWGWTMGFWGYTHFIHLSLYQTTSINWCTFKFTKSFFCDLEFTVKIFTSVTGLMWNFLLYFHFGY
jgi:hypothetical protein